jgi:cold shock CspA family protein
MTGDVFVHQSKIMPKEGEEHRHLNRGDAVEFWVLYNSRKDRIEAQDVYNISRKQLKSKTQLEAKRKQEKEECLRRMEKEDKERKEWEKDHQDKMDKKAEELVSQMRYKKYIEFKASEKKYRVCQRVDGDYIPELLYNSGYYLTCDLCGKNEHIRTGSPPSPVVKKKIVETPILWGFSSYNATVHYLTDGKREVEVDIHKVKRPFERIGCIHEFAKFS